MSLLIKGVTAHTGLTDKDPAGVIDHANLSVTDGKLASGVGLADTQIAKLPVATDGQALVRGGVNWGAGTPVGAMRARKNYQMPVTGTRPQMNLVEGAAIGIQVADNPSDNEFDIIINAKYPTQNIVLVPDDAVLPVANPPAQSSVDGANFSYATLDFDQATEESCFWDWYLTPDYRNENIEVFIYWISVGAGNVKFGVRTLGREKGETWDAAMGVEQTVVQPNAGAGLVNVAKINSFSPGWLASDNVIFKLARKAADGADTLDADARVLKVITRYTGQFAQSFYPLVSPVNVIPANLSAWTDVDVSAYIPKGATGVILHWNVSLAGTTTAGLRKNGSSDARTGSITADNHRWAMIGVDENLIFEAYNSLAGVELWLIGYTASGVVFFDSGFEISNSAIHVYENKDVSAQCPAGTVAVILEYHSTAGDVAWAIRPNGAAYDYYTFSQGMKTWVIVGVDANRIFQYKTSNLVSKMYLIGYISSGYVVKTAPPDKDPAGTGAYEDINCAADAPSAIFLVFQVAHLAALKRTAIRKNGSTEDIYRNMRQDWAIVPCDANQIVEIKVATTEGGCYLVGYAQWAGA